MNSLRHCLTDCIETMSIYKNKVLKSTKSNFGNEIFLVSACQATESTKLIIGVVHGDEPQGKYLIDEYLKKRKIIANEVKNNPHLLFIPCLNPDGMYLNQRTNANGVDLNRNFPTKNWESTEKKQFFGGNQPASEIETRFVMQIIEEYKPQTILTLHAPYKVVNFDGPAEEIAQKISDIIHYPVQKDIGYHTPGSLGTYAGTERQIAAITLELDETCPVENLINPVHNIFDIL